MMVKGFWFVVIALSIYHYPRERRRKNQGGQASCYQGKIGILCILTSLPAPAQLGKQSCGDDVSCFNAMSRNARKLG